MSKIRLIRSGDPTDEDVTFADAARNAVDAAIAAGAIVMLIAYETQERVNYIAVPNSDALARGLARDISVVLGADE